MIFEIGHYLDTILIVLFINTLVSRVRLAHFLFGRVFFPSSIEILHKYLLNSSSSITRLSSFIIGLLDPIH